MWPAELCVASIEVHVARYSHSPAKSWSPVNIPVTKQHHQPKVTSQWHKLRKQHSSILCILMGAVIHCSMIHRALQESLACKMWSHSKLFWALVASCVNAAPKTMEPSRACGKLFTHFSYKPVFCKYPLEHTAPRTKNTATMVQIPEPTLANPEGSSELHLQLSFVLWFHEPCQMPFRNSWLLTCGFP